MEHDKLNDVDHCIRDAAGEAAAGYGLSASTLERFLRTREETWDGARSGRFTLGQIKQDEIYTQAARTALRNLFRFLADLIPTEIQSATSITQEVIRQRVTRW